MQTRELRARAKDLPLVYWHHTIRLFLDLVIDGGKFGALLEAERAAILDTANLAGRSVADVGTWNGYFAFEAKRAGASRVIATDSVVWQSPHFRGRETFELARASLGIDLEVIEIDPTEMPGLSNRSMWCCSSACSTT
jgi:tRNA (mo5U34)-methyltransferase